MHVASLNLVDRMHFRKSGPTHNSLGMDPSPAQGADAVEAPGSSGSRRLPAGLVWADTQQQQQRPASKLAAVEKTMAAGRDAGASTESTQWGGK